MKQHEARMPCPSCGETITFPTIALIRGNSIACDSCGAVIGVDSHHHEPAQEKTDKGE